MRLVFVAACAVLAACGGTDEGSGDDPADGETPTADTSTDDTEQVGDMEVSALEIIPKPERQAANGKVTVVDEAGEPVEGADVLMAWRVGDRDDDGEATTNSKGRAVSTLPRVQTGDEVTLCVATIEHPDHRYEPDQSDCVTLTLP